MAGPSTRPLVWIHVGSAEAIPALLDLTERARALQPGVQFVLTAPAQIAVSFKDTVRPFDIDKVGKSGTPPSGVSPDIALSVDDTVSLPLLHMMERAGIPLILVQPRLEKLQNRPWLWRKTVLRPVLARVKRSFAGSADQVQSLKALGVPPYRVEQIGPLCENPIPPPCNEAEQEALSPGLATRPVCYFHNIYAGEVDTVLAAIRVARRGAHRMLALIDAGPDLPEDTLRAAITQQNLLVHSRAVEGEPNALTEVFLTDPGTEIGLWYRLASLCVLGGSFVGRPSPNPLLAAALGCAIVHGPHIVDWTAAHSRLLSAGASARVGMPERLGARLTESMPPDRTAQMAMAGWDVVTTGAATMDRLMAHIFERLGLSAEGDMA